MSYYFVVVFFIFVPVPGYSWEFIITSDSHSRNVGMDFFSFPSCSRILGLDFVIPFPFPNFGNGFFHSPSRSRIEGMFFFNSLPVPEPSKVIPAHPCFPGVFFYSLLYLAQQPNTMYSRLSDLYSFLSSHSYHNHVYISALA